MPRAPVIPNHMFAPPRGKGRKARLNRRVDATEGMLSVGTVMSNEDFAGAVVSLLDEVAQVSSHGSDRMNSLLSPHSLLIHEWDEFVFKEKLCGFVLVLNFCGLCLLVIGIESREPSGGYHAGHTHRRSLLAVV